MSPDSAKWHATCLRVRDHEPVLQFPEGKVMSSKLISNMGQHARQLILFHLRTSLNHKGFLDIYGFGYQSRLTCHQIDDESFHMQDQHFLSSQFCTGYLVMVVFLTMVR